MNKPQISTTSLPELVVARVTQDEVRNVFTDLGVSDSGTVQQIQQICSERGLSVIEAARALECIDEDSLRHSLIEKFGLTPVVDESDSALSKELAALFAPQHPYVGELRIVREELAARWFNPTRHALVIGGMENGIGSSRVAANLAVLYAQRGNRVLLIDTNMENQNQREFFSIASMIGLTDCMVGWASCDAAATKVPQVPGLSVLTVGTLPPGPCEILSRREFGEVVRKAEEDFDIVLVDVAAAHNNGDLGDLIAASASVGGALLVMRKNHSRMERVRVASAQIRSVGAQVVGAVLDEF